ncbi:carbohydrate ABC transporter permease [Salininema proteolyticum]|uniref:Carbohydrate ABC transporter permease n=1 Tax=Salininema proteolyticum TaxID=1607685 RepID=A0ABV8U5C6_9ACTN
MPIYPIMLPLFAATAIAGGAAGWLAWRRAGLPRAWAGAGVGAAAGALGPLLTMIPLQSCTFEPDRTGLDNSVGVVAFLAPAAVLTALAVWFGRALTSPGGAANLDSGEHGPTFRHSRSAWLFLAPTLAVLVLFLYWPLLETLRLSTQLTKRGTAVERFVCVDNYTALLDPSFEWWAVALASLAVAAVLATVVVEKRQSDPFLSPLPKLKTFSGLAVVAAVVAVAASVFGPDYRGVFLTTLVLAGGTVVLALAIGLGIALLVSRPIRGRSVYRVLLIWPFAISPPIAGILFFVMFDPATGIVGHAWESLTPWDMPNYRTEPALARTLVIMASVWKTLGFIIVFYVAGLQNVSRDMIEAARIDGASAWQRLRHFIIPSLSPITFFLIVTTVTYAFFEIFGTIDYLTKGGPNGATTDAMTSVYLSQEWIGAGAARSLVLFAMVLAVTAWQFRSTGRKVHYGH